MERKKIGRPSKGDRRPVCFKLPTPLIEAMRKHAAQKGMTVTDLVGELLAAGIGMDYYQIQIQIQTQEGLPLNKAS